MTPYRVAVLGATGLVGQRLVQRLAGHPWFTVAALVASDRSAGRRYDEATTWRLPDRPPADVAAMKVRTCAVEALEDCDVALSALDAAVARSIEPELVAAGLAVVSNSSAYREADDVPLLVPEVNAAHLALLDGRRGGFLVTNPNCSVTGLALALAPLDRAFGLRRVVVTTLQAISGAGLDGPRALDLVDNVVPHIPGEEEKIESELGKILGRVADRRVERAAVAVSAHCHRVGTLDGHLEAVSIEFGEDVSPERAREALAAFRGDAAARGLPSAPPRPIVLRDEPDRPQPRLDRDTGAGMAVVVGRVRRCAVLGLKLELLSHNTVRGAAGGALLNAELLAAEGRLPRRTGA